MTRVLFLQEDAAVPTGAVILYEAEWNEEAGRGEHVAALFHFAGLQGEETFDAVEQALSHGEDPSTGFVAVVA